MILWRIARTPFADLSGEGARLFGGRWNSPGIAVIYLADHPALALLEILVHLDVALDLLPNDYELMCVSIANDVPVTAIPNVNTGANDLRLAGDIWAKSKESALLRVASVLLPEANNYVLNPTHSDSHKVTIASKRLLEIDQRLFKK